MGAPRRKLRRLLIILAARGAPRRKPQRLLIILRVQQALGGPKRWLPTLR